MVQRSTNVPWGPKMLQPKPPAASHLAGARPRGVPWASPVWWKKTPSTWPPFESEVKSEFPSLIIAIACHSSQAVPSRAKPPGRNTGQPQASRRNRWGSTQGLLSNSAPWCLMFEQHRFVMKTGSFLHTYRQAKFDHALLMVGHAARLGCHPHIRWSSITGKWTSS